METKQSQMIKTSCLLCSLGCGMNVHLDQGKIVSIEGMKEHPLNLGELCPKGEAAVEYVYSPARITHPMKRVGENWQQISWDEALDTIADKLNQVKQTYGAGAFAVCIGMSVLLSGSSTVGLIRRFCYAYGSPNCFSVESMCYRCRIISYMLTLGRFRVADPENADCIILWGHNPDVSMPPIGAMVHRGLEKGAKLIVIDPRTTTIASQADIHVKIRPGTDCALILGLLNVIISENLYDHEFVSNWTVGFDRLKEHVKRYPPEEVASITGVPAPTTREVARLFAQSKSACILQGINALDQHSTGVQNGRGVAILQAITGNIDVAGGFIRGPRLRTTPIEVPVKLEEKAIGQSEYSVFWGIWGREFGEGQAMMLPDTLLTDKPHPIKSIIISGSNPLLTWPNSKKVEAAFKKLDFLVVMDQFMTETARLAHLVLPAASFLERLELCDYYSLWGIPYAMLRKKVIEYEECWPDLKFWFELAKKMGYQEYFPWKDIDEALEYILEPSGLSIEQLSEINSSGLFYGKINYREYEKHGFPTPSGKVELYSETLAEMGHDPMPTYREPLESPVSTPDLAREYPLILTTGARTLEFCHSQLRMVPSLHKRAPEPIADIHRDTAAEYGILDGEMGVVETKRGNIELKFKVSEDILPGIVSIPHAWAQANANILTDEKSADPVIGYPNLKALLCRVYRRT